LIFTGHPSSLVGRIRARCSSAGKIDALDGLSILLPGNYHLSTSDKLFLM
jgi:hypothetical protein